MNAALYGRPVYGGTMSEDSTASRQHAPADVAPELHEEGSDA
ncbi:hypothetical protein ACFQNI_12045 [Salinirubellus salinus]